MHPTYLAMRERAHTAILEAAIAESLAEGYLSITREQVAKRAGVALGSINQRFGTMRDLRRAVLHEAVRRPILPILAEGLAQRHEIAMAAPPELRQQAAASTAG